MSELQFCSVLLVMRQCLLLAEHGGHERTHRHLVENNAGLISQICYLSVSFMETVD